MKKTTGNVFSIVTLLGLLALIVGFGWLITHNPCPLEGTIGTILSLIMWGVEVGMLGLFTVLLYNFIMRMAVWRDDFRHPIEDLDHFSIIPQAEDVIQEKDGYVLVLQHVIVDPRRYRPQSGRSFMPQHDRAFAWMVRPKGKKTPNHWNEFSYGITRRIYRQVMKEGLAHFSEAIEELKCREPNSA